MICVANLAVKVRVILSPSPRTESEGTDGVEVGAVAGADLGEELPSWVWYRQRVRLSP